MRRLEQKYVKESDASMPVRHENSTNMLDPEATLKN